MLVITGRGATVQIIQKKRQDWRNQGSHCPFLLAEVTEVVKKLMVDKIHPEVLNALDVVELPWLAHLFNIAWVSGTGPCDGCVGSSYLKKRKRKKRKVPWRVCPRYRAITLLSMSGKAYSVCDIHKQDLKVQLKGEECPA